MKIFRAILRFSGLSLVTLIASVFAFLELRFIFSGEFLIFNNPFIGFLQLFLKASYFLGYVSLAVSLFIFTLKKIPPLRLFYFLSTGLVFSSLLLFLAYEYYVVLVFFVLGFILLFISIFYFYKQKQTEE